MSEILAQSSDDTFLAIIQDSLTSTSTDLPGLWLSFLQQELTSTSSDVSQLENIWLADKTSDIATTIDLWYIYLLSLGYIGTIPDMIRAAALAGNLLSIHLWLRNVLSLTATIGTNSTFSRGGSTVYVPAWDMTTGLVLIEIPADAIASPGMRYDSGVWFNDDGADTALHPTNSDGIFIVYPSWVNSTVYAANSYSVDYVGNHAKYYKTVAGGTSNGTGVADDIGVTDWILQGNYSNLGGGALPGLLSEPLIVNKTTCQKNNPTGLTNITLGGDVLATLAVVDDTTALTTAGLIGICTNGKVYKLDNSLGSVSAFAVISGDTGNTANHSGSIYMRASAGTPRYGWFITAGSEFGQTAASTYTRLSGDDRAVGSVFYRTMVTVLAGAVAYFILPQLEEYPVTTSVIPGETTGAVQRNASVEANLHLITALFIRYRVTNIHTETHLTDSTNSFDYDEATTTLTFTDGTTTLSTVTTLEIGDTIVLDQTDGKLYVNGVLKDTDGALDPAWAAITGIGNITDLTEATNIDPTDTTWDKA